MCIDKQTAYYWLVQLTCNIEKLPELLTVGMESVEVGIESLTVGNAYSVTLVGYTTVSLSATVIIILCT